MSRQYRMERSSKRFRLPNANLKFARDIPQENLKVSNDLTAFQWIKGDG